MPTDRLYSAPLRSDRHRSRRRLPRVVRGALRGPAWRLWPIAWRSPARCLVHVCRWLAQTLLGPRGPIDMDRDFAESYPHEKRADLRKELDYFAQVRAAVARIPSPPVLPLARAAISRVRSRFPSSPQPLF